MLEHPADFISREALGGCASYSSDHRAELAGRDRLTEIRSRRLRDALFHQRAAEIVCSGFKTRQRPLKTKLDPRDLNVWYVAVQKHAREPMDDQILADRMSSARASALEQLRLGMDESQGNEFSESTRFL